MVWIIGVALGLFLYVAFPRHRFIAGFVIIASIALTVAFFAFEQRQVQGRADQIVATAAYAPQGCTDPFAPFEVTLANGTGREVASIALTLIGRPAGARHTVYSTAHALGPLAPGQTLTQCLPLDRYAATGIDFANLAFEAEVTSIRLR